MHINSKKLMTVLKALKLKIVFGREVLVYSDNTTTLVNKEVWGNYFPRIACDAKVEIGQMISESDVPLCFSVFTNASYNINVRFQKQKVYALGKKAPELDEMEDQRRFLEIQGLGTYAVDCILSN
ncbi:hypothetical protein AYI69_g4769 [Smittium culicis]|uniref:Uncharacterized protein n=1 Tax=Smittium culicis TaxID=133412 RepID=A0A1R1YB14_9FUNG|nr:hypothetical protein AYI69_g4769 [Smittium culicis]